jgi:hypothetical protein
MVLPSRACTNLNPREPEVVPEPSGWSDRTPPSGCDITSGATGAAQAQSAQEFVNKVAMA